MCVCVCVFVCVFVCLFVYVYVCVWEREGEIDRQTDRECYSVNQVNLPNESAGGSNIYNCTFVKEMDCRLKKTLSV